MALTKHQLRFDATVGNCDEVKTFLFASDGTALTQTGGALDVNLASGTITLTEEDNYDEDSAHASGDKGGFVLSVRADDLDAVPAGILAGTEGDYQAFITGPEGQLFVADPAVLAQLVSGITVSDGGGSLTVDAVDFDIRNLAFATDGVDVSGSEVSLDAATLAALENVVVSATDLDIRDLDAASDSVQAWAHDGVGNAIESINGHLKVVDCTDTATYSAQALTAAAAAVAVSAVSGQSFMEIQNNSSDPVYMTAAAATAASPGLCIPCGGHWSGKVCGAVHLYSDATIAAADLQIAQYAIS